MSNTSAIEFISGLPKDYRRAKSRKVTPQAAKVRFLATRMLTRFFRNGSCSVTKLEEDAADHVSGRITLTLGAGAGGKGGMAIIRDGDNIPCCRDNALNLLHQLGENGLEGWLAKENVQLADLKKWIDGLPSV